jgi:hypothetical protein
MTRDEQRWTEREDIETFVRLSGIAVDDLAFGDSPDAVLMTNGRRVAVEHRELEEEDLRSNRDNVLAFEGILDRELRSLGVRVHVGVGIDASAPLFRRHRDVEALAKRLALLVRSHASEVPLRPGTPWIREQGFPELVMLSLESGDQPRAIVSPAAWGPGTTSIEAAIRAKEAKLATYRAGVDEAWLLLVTGADWTQMTDSALTQGLKLASDFDAVFLLDLRERRVQRLT